MASFGFNKSPEAFIQEGEVDRRLYELIVPQYKARAIDPKTFEDHYGKEAVEKDLAYVNRMEEKFRESDRETNSLSGARRGELFEAIVATSIEKYGWLGEDTEIVIPSRYDDIVNKTDLILVLKFDLGHSTLALTIDMTKDPESLAKKIDDIKKTIEDKTPSKIKYFQYAGFKGEQTNVPRVVVGADQKNIGDLTEAVLQTKKMEKHNVSTQSETWQNVQKQIRNHPFQYQIIDEIKLQLETFERYALRYANPELARRYREALHIIMHIAAKKESPKNHPSRGQSDKHDAVYTEIVNQMEKLKPRENR